jgi:hypothetical protein
MRHGCTISPLTQSKLECSGTLKFSGSQGIWSVSIFWKRYDICILGCQRSHPRSIHVLWHNNQSENGYSDTLCRLREAIRRKKPGHLSRGVILQHDRANPTHRTSATRAVAVISLRASGQFTLQSRHCPVGLPGPLKQRLGGRRFHNNGKAELVANARARFLPRRHFYTRAKMGRKHHVFGDYVEK